MPQRDAAHLILRFRIVMLLFICGLVISGITAFPLRWELDTLASWLGVGTGADPAALSGLRYWIGFVRDGLRHSYETYPFLAYGTDWLAFAHLVIAVFFLGPLVKPTGHEWVLISGVIGCA